MDQFFCLLIFLTHDPVWQKCTHTCFGVGKKKKTGETKISWPLKSYSPHRFKQSLYLSWTSTTFKMLSSIRTALDNALYTVD